MSTGQENTRSAFFAVLLVSVLSFLMTLTACRLEIGEVDPFASPSPSPDASPSPSPSPSASPSPSPSAASTASVSLTEFSSAAVASENAELLEQATTTASEESANLDDAVQRAMAAPETAAGEIPKALASLSAVEDSYRSAEAAVFYVNPEDSAELAAQPDPLGAGANGTETNSLAAVSAKLKALVASVSGEQDEAALREALGILDDLAARSAELRAQMDALAAAWKESDTSFRERYFLASPDNAVARIFQGLLALSGDVLPNHWLASGEGGQNPVPDADEVLGRIDALRGIYLVSGTGNEADKATGLDDLVAAASPARAAATRASIAQMAALAQALKFSPENAETRRQLLGALEEVTRQLTLSAQVLGIEIVENGSDG